MAAASSFPVPKRKKQVYGKLVSKSHWNVDSFFDEDELASPEPAETQRHTLKASYPVKKAETKTYGSKNARPKSKRQDTFDVPSSDDEVTSPAKVVSPPRFHKTNALHDDTDSSHAPLAPWERKRLQSDHNDSGRGRRTTSASPEAQLKQDLMRAASSPEAIKPTSPSLKEQGQGMKKDLAPVEIIEPQQTSAMARLTARRRELTSSLAKRGALHTAETHDTPRKRIRTSPGDKRHAESSHEMHLVSCEPSDEMPVSDEPMQDIYDLPASSDDEKTKAKRGILGPSAGKAPTQRGKLTAYGTKRTVQECLSAPARLTEMLTDTDATEAPTRSPSATSRLSSPQHVPSTPPSGKSGSPGAALKSPGTMTPKQAQLWHDLLPSDMAAPSPSTLPIKDLSISEKRRKEVSFKRQLSKSRPDASRRRTRLVDRLKASVPDSDDVSEAEESSSDVGMIDDVPPEQKQSQLPERPSLAKRTSSHISQPTTATLKSGPKITYAQSRSYMQEDGIEQDFLADIDAEMAQSVMPSKRAGKPAANAKKSAFDMDVSDEEIASGKIRNIHELRASGRTIAGMYDIEELLGEIQNHSLPHRSRRRSALMELATKLTNKTFAMRFIGQGCEAELGAECNAAGDEIADFIIAGAFALILASEPPEHAVTSLRDQGVLTWLSRRLTQEADVATLAKDRRNNMSKAAQTSFREFGETLTKQTVLWGESLSIGLTPRLVALKALDLLMTKLRRLGDRSELLGVDDVSVILPSNCTLHPGSMMEVGLSISILESLSTSSASLLWPESTLETIVQILPRLDTTLPSSQHTTFLTLRLCLNLTNDNARNCQILAKESTVVHHLLQVVQQGFSSIDTELEDEKRALALDLLVLSMGIMINFAENCDEARQHAVSAEDTLTSLIAIFQSGQKNMLEAESVEESVTNVAFGYLAVMLSNLCQNATIRSFIAARLPGKNLDMLIEAVEEFVLHHQKVDMMNFEGEEGREVWGAFTEKLKLVLVRLKEVESGA